MSTRAWCALPPRACARATCTTSSSRRKPRTTGQNHSPSMHKYGDVFVPSGLSAERAQPATCAESRSWPSLRVEVRSGQPVAHVGHADDLPAPEEDTRHARRQRRGDLVVDGARQTRHLLGGNPCGPLAANQDHLIVAVSYTHLRAHETDSY